MVVMLVEEAATDRQRFKSFDRARQTTIHFYLNSGHKKQNLHTIWREETARDANLTFCQIIWEVAVVGWLVSNRRSSEAK